VGFSDQPFNASIPSDAWSNTPTVSVGAAKTLNGGCNGAEGQNLTIFMVDEIIADPTRS
jgi:hypothetical protein